MAKVVATSASIESGPGPDEKRILDALHGRGPVGRRLKREMKTDRRAKYKIEVHFGKNRRIAREALNTGAILIWESGRRFHGGGDDKMYWCGWGKDWTHVDTDKVCGKPIPTMFFGANHVMCPHCQRDNFLDPIVKQRHIVVAKEEGNDTRGLERTPIVVGERFFNMTPMNLAWLLKRYWYDLECNSDIYFKYHPTDIRCRDIVSDVKKIDRYKRAREKRRTDGLLIYPLTRISKDISTGASVEKRFLAMICA